MAGTIHTDTVAWPLVVIRFSDEAGPIGDDEYVAFFESIRDILRKTSPFAIVTDIHMTAPASASQRRMLTDWLKEVEAPTRRWAVGVAIVVRSAVIRGALRAVFWVREPAAPTLVVASLHDGLEYCFKQLEASGVAGRSARQKWKDSRPGVKSR